MLHLTDWHLRDYDHLQNIANQKHFNGEIDKEKHDNLCIRYQKGEIKQKEYLNQVKAKSYEFLKSKGRSSFDIIYITGDMMDRNGSGASHQIAVDAINDLKVKHEDICVIGRDTKIYVCPGNHCSDTKITKEILEQPACLDALCQQALPNSIIVDKHISRLKDGFEKYVQFAQGIVATNKDNPFHGFDRFRVGDTSIFISWFNSGWLSVEKSTWKDLTITRDKKDWLFSDMDNISVGHKINEDIYREKEKFDQEGGKQFSFSLTHHHPRHLDWFDKNVMDHELSIGKEKYDQWHECIACTKKSENEYAFTKNTCIYNHYKSYSLNINGHTHGSLLDDNFATSSGGVNTPQATISTNYLSIFTLDTIRELTTRFEHSLDNSISDPKPVIYPHNTTDLEQRLKSNYQASDLFEDLRANGLLKKEALIPDQVAHYQSIEHLGRNLSTTENGTVLAVEEKKLVHNPLKIKDIEDEIGGLSHIHENII